MTTCFGRDDELAALVVLLASERLITLTGPGGVGKTRLAQELVERTGSGYRVTAFVGLEPVADGMLIEGTVAAALALGESGRVTRDEIARALTGGLLVLDNCEHLVAAAGTFATALLAASPDLRIVATSRQALNVAGECVRAVAPLPVPDPDAAVEQARSSAAVAMLEDRVAAIARGFTVDAGNVADVIRICRRLDGLPLALELTAPRLRILRPRELAALLDGRAQMLGAPTRGATHRRRTLRETIAWSYELLDDEARTAFRAVATFANPWTLDAATAVFAPGDATKTRTAVDGLIERSLVTFAESDPDAAYRLLQPIREFALEVTSREERARFRNRHAGYVQGLAAASHAQAQRILLNRLEASIDDVRAALQWTVLGDGDRHQGLRIASDLTRFWIARLAFGAEGVRWLERAIERAGESAGAAPLAEACHALGRLLIRRSQYRDAAAACLRALKLARVAGDETAVARILNTLGVLSAIRGQLGRARIFHAAHLAHARRAGDRHRVAMTLSDLGALAIGTDDLQGGIRHLDEAIALFRELWGEVEDAHNLALALMYRGVATHLEGDSSGALHFFDEAVAQADSLGSKGLRSAVLAEQGGVYAALRDVANARRVLVQAIRDADDVNYLTTIPRACDLLAETVAFEGRSRDAAVVFGAGDTLRRKLGIARTPEDEAMAARLRGALVEQLGEGQWAAATRRGADMPFDALLTLAAFPAGVR